MVTRGIFVGGLLAVFVVTQLPFIEAVTITSICRHGGVWIVEGTITINPRETPAKMEYNRDPNGFLFWWEQHINEVLESQRIRAVQVRNLHLWFISVSPTRDVIGFQAELVFRAKNPAIFG